MNDEINTALVKKPQCIDCRFYDGFGSCSKHGYQLRDNCEDYADMKTIHKYVEDMENYEKKYTEALERAETLIEKLESTHIKGFIYHIFPELQENKDDRIRKGIIRNLQYLMDRSEGFVKEDLQERIAWLEKQGNNPVNIDVESMVSSYEQRLESQGGTKYTPLVNMCLTSFRHGVENVLEELNLKKLEKQGEKKNTHKREIDDAYLQGMCDEKHEIEKQSKKLDADEVFQWLCNYKATLFGAKWCKTENIIEQFRKDFGL